MRIQLLPGLTRAWRGPASLQLGVSPRRSAVLDGLTTADVRLLGRLVDGVDSDELTALTEVDGPSGARTAEAAAASAELVAVLRTAGALVPARAGRSARAVLGGVRDDLEPDAAAWALVHRGSGDGWDLLAARTRHHVVVVGTGRVVEATAAALRAAEVGGVETLTRLTERSLRARAGKGLGTPPSCVVLVEPAAADPVRADELVRRDLAHLSVVVREGDVVVGPLVVPGAGPCLRCLDLHRAGADPAWPGVLAQLLAARPALPEETTLAAIAGRLAALQVLALLDGRTRPAALGATLEVELPDGLVTRRPWPAHPGCGCHWPPAGPADEDAPTTSPDHAARPGAPAGRMDP